MQLSRGSGPAIDWLEEGGQFAVAPIADALKYQLVPEVSLAAVDGIPVLRWSGTARMVRGAFGRCLTSSFA